MSRSYRKPVATITNQIDKEHANKQLRHIVKAELKKAEPDEVLLDADTRDIGVEEWGTKLGFIYIDKDAPNWEKEAKKKLERK